MKLIALLMTVLSAVSAMMPGGVSQWIPIEKNSQMYNQFKGYQPFVEGYAKTRYSSFEPTHYTQQVVAGMNYSIRYMVNTNELIEAQVYQPLMIPGMNSNPQVNSVKSLGKMIMPVAILLL